MEKEKKVIGYLPDECPPIWKLLLYALQQVIVMFPATIVVALISGFHISTTIFASGFATLVFILITGRQIPLYYGSSFSYLSAIIGFAGAVQYGEVLPDAALSEAQFGIILSGLVSIVAGLIIKRFGRQSIEKVLPSTVTGPIAMIIGLTLASNALTDFLPAMAATEDGSFAFAEGGTNLHLLVAAVTLISTIVFSVYCKGLWAQIPLLLGPLCGCAVAGIIILCGGPNLFRDLSSTAANTSGFFAIPHFTLPKPSLAAVVAIMPIAIATIPESTAHIFQLDIYINDLAKKKGSKKEYKLADLLGLNLIGDGIGDMIAGFVGGPAGTNYGENISCMAITKVFSVPVLIAAAVIAMIISCFTPLVNAIYAIPTAVIGGLEVYLFGAIAAQGIAIMIDKKTDMFDAKNIAIIAVEMVLGIGGNYAFGGVPVIIGGKCYNLPCIAIAAIVGIILNLLFSIKKDEPQAEAVSEEKTE